MTLCFSRFLVGWIKALKTKTSQQLASRPQASFVNSKLVMAPIQKRDYCSGDANCLNPSSPWYEYGRWILLAIIIALAIVIFAIFAFWSARRRKRLGDNPLPLTGWAHRPPASQWEQGYKNQGPGSEISGQTNGIAHPEPVHGDYTPPTGPPSGKTAI